MLLMAAYASLFFVCAEAPAVMASASKRVNTFFFIFV